MPAAKNISSSLEVMRLLSREFLEEVFRYDPGTGKIYWQTRPPEHFSLSRAWKRFNTQYAGREVGSLGCGDYLVMNLNVGGVPHHISLHHLVWKLHDRKFEPGKVLDHINRDRTDNRIENLRSVTRSENARNSTRRVTFSSGQRCIYKKGSRWQVVVNHPDKRGSLGTFATVEEAVAARDAAEMEAFGELKNAAPSEQNYLPFTFVCG